MGHMERVSCANCNIVNELSELWTPMHRCTSCGYRLMFYQPLPRFRGRVLDGISHLTSDELSVLELLYKEGQV